MINQCSSCGGFCKKSGCERENLKPTIRKNIKELTDEEIEELANEYLFAEEDLGMLFVGGSVEFARAVEKRIKNGN